MTGSTPRWKPQEGQSQVEHPYPLRQAGGPYAGAPSAGSGGTSPFTARGAAADG